MKVITMEDFDKIWKSLDLDSSGHHQKFLSFLTSGDTSHLFSQEAFRLEMSYAFLGDVPPPKCDAESQIRELLREKWPLEKRWW